MKATYTIKSDAAFLRMVDEVAQMQPVIKAKESELDARLQAVRSELTPALADLKAEYDARMSALKSYFADEKVQSRLILPGKKHGESANATFTLRMGKPKITAADGMTEADAVALLLKEDRTEWLRNRAPELNKAAILGAGLTADELLDYGLTLITESKFCVTPKDTKP
ncbi:MAG TPA: hypothetical protein H9862_07030 [Candidatus Akkermansia intestinigallinarum]|uniref:Host-nuclease inhibitor protein Gam n=1 Tax=Candidatus Akkermansia intestinigallinarum TaxID=2838431 RepID=A0A9D1VBZ5_9BACT|nr:hypothetical protein [Candidatus Akkermansia intestinigallinarum]